MTSLQPNLERLFQQNNRLSLLSSSGVNTNRLIEDCWGKSFRDFNHIIGLPRKDEEDEMNVEHPIYDYEIDLVKKFRQYQHIWILKSRGLGITEIVLRYFAWLCLSSDYYAGKFIHIVTGTKESFAAKLIQRLINILQRNYSDVKFPSRYTELLLNKTLIEAYPTKKLKDLRGHVDVSLIFIDEADFFDKSEQDELPYVIKSYEEKSNAKIIMVSTPNRPDGLFHAIEDGQMFKGFFHQEKLSYMIGLDKIYSRKFIEREMEEPEFEREYNLKYIGKRGNVFTPQQIAHCVDIGERYSLTRFPINQNCLHLGGVDYGFSSSKSTLYIAELMPDVDCIRIIIGREYDKKTPSFIAERMHDFHREIRNLWWYVDGSNRGAVNEVKVKFGEELNWETKLGVSWEGNRILPVPFSVEHVPMLKHMYMLVSKGKLAIPKSMQKLIISMRTAQAVDFDLNKDDTVNNDHLDAVRLLLKGEVSLDDARK